MKKVIFVGPGDQFNIHGMKLDRGIVYSVTDAAFDYLRVIRGIYEVKDIKDDIVGFGGAVKSKKKKKGK